MSYSIDDLPKTRGRITANAPLGSVGWFRCGGNAEFLFKPDDELDLQNFLANLPREIPVSVFGVLSNTIIRDDGMRGVVVRLGREFAGIKRVNDTDIVVGAACLDVNASMQCAELGIGNLEFLSGVPGTIGGALKMNAGAYGREIKDVLVTAYGVDREGAVHEFNAAQMGFSYRHSSVPDDIIFTRALLRGCVDEPEIIQARMNEIKQKREASQPVREKTGGSTFANPSEADLIAAGLPITTKSWQLVDMVGGRGLKIGGAMMSELHANFMINTGDASASDLEALGDEIKRRVKEKFGLDLRWEIKRVGE
jgi:UDP-N-acetylmuramate dehydrogenase